MLPSKSCSRNIYMMLGKDFLTREYGGSLKVIKVEGHQNDEKSYKDLNFQGRRNVYCVAPENIAIVRTEVCNYVTKLQPVVKP